MADKKLIEIILSVRGGAGGVSAAKILAEAAIRCGKFAQSMSEFNAERRGASFPAYVRISDRPIHAQYEILDPADIVICFEEPLLKEELIKDNGVLVIDRAGKTSSARYDTIYVDALKIARGLKLISSEGNVFTNTVFLGAALKVLPDIRPEILFGVIGEMLDEKNSEAARRGFKLATISPRDPKAARTAVKKTSGKKKKFRPFLDSDATTEGNFTGDWRTQKPEIQESCNVCGLCIPLCPENVISVVGEKLAIDYDFCKGCAMCNEICPLKEKGIVMAEEGRKEGRD